MKKTVYIITLAVTLNLAAFGQTRSTSPLDKRLVPVSAAQGFFYRQKWTTAEGKAMAEKVPTKGNPFPVPSTAVK